MKNKHEKTVDIPQDFLKQIPDWVPVALLEKTWSMQLEFAHQIALHFRNKVTGANEGMYLINNKPVNEEEFNSELQKCSTSGDECTDDWITCTYDIDEQSGVSTWDVRTKSVDGRLVARFEVNGDSLKLTDSELSNLRQGKA